MNESVTDSPSFLAPYVYLVRCRFEGDVDMEMAWNSWYSGPKAESMLQLPQFLSGQRFRSVDSSERWYIAIWGLSSTDVFEADDYRRRWGFFEWQQSISGWSRDLLTPRSDSSRLAISSGQFLQVSAQNDEPGGNENDVIVLEAAGLDETWPWISLCPTTHPPPVESRAEGLVWRTLFEPITEFMTP